MKGKGFTLMELMIVVAIISVLASIIIPNITKAKQQAQVRACTESLKSYGQAYEMYRIDHPDNNIFNLNSLAPDYIREIPTCSLGGNYNSNWVGTYDGTDGVGYYQIYCFRRHSPSMIITYTPGHGITISE